MFQKDEVQKYEIFLKNNISIDLISIFAS